MEQPPLAVEDPQMGLGRVADKQLVLHLDAVVLRDISDGNVLPQV